MKRVLLLVLITLFSSVCYGQNGGHLKFLGIPIDGTEAQFASKLKSKGFTYSPVTEGYKGQFNGQNVDVYIHTNHNLVDRVYVSFPYTNEDGIRSEFNRLLGQFEDNDKYTAFVVNEKIPADDDISYEISVKNKRYQASFSYFDPDRDQVAFMNSLLDKLSEFLTEEQRAKVKEMFAKTIDAPKEQQDAIQAEMMEELQKMGLGQNENAEPDLDKAMRFFAATMEGMSSLADGEVWFMIHERYGRYQIGRYYDNLHNQAHGEDL